MAYPPLLVVIVVEINQQDTPPFSASPYTRNHHSSDPDKWDTFQHRYRAELGSGEQAEAFEQLRNMYDRGRVTLVFAAKDRKFNNAVVLKQSLQGN